MRTIALSIHRGYACQRSGACCTAGWTIPVERETADRLAAAIDGGGIACDPDLPANALLVPLTRAPAEYPVALGTRADTGACVFFEPARGRLCRVHRCLGHASLPLACRQFPRVVLTDDRGMFLTLSHYCPTAAARLLCDEVPLAIEEHLAAGDGSSEEYEGLDASGTLPPLLRPDALMTLDAVSSWEAFAVRVLARDDLTPESALGLVAAAAERVRGWRAADGELDAHVLAVTSDVERERRPVGDMALTRPEQAANWIAVARDAVPPHLAARAAAWPAAGGARAETVPIQHARAIRRYLAARALGSWALYQGRGLRTWVRAAAVALAVVRHELNRTTDQPGTCDAALIQAVRAADLLLVHLADPDVLHARLSEDEDRPLD